MVMMMIIIIIDSAVACLNVAVIGATEQSIPSGIINSNLECPHWYSSSLRNYIKKKNYYYRRFNKKKSDCLYEQFTFYRKLVKATLKSAELHGLIMLIILKFTTQIVLEVYGLF
jgi:hypothetical protein